MWDCTSLVVHIFIPARGRKGTGINTLTKCASAPSSPVYSSQIPFHILQRDQSTFVFLTAHLSTFALYFRKVMGEENKRIKEKLLCIFFHSFHLLRVQIMEPSILISNLNSMTLVNLLSLCLGFFVCSMGTMKLL